MKELEEILGTENIKYNEPMSKHTTFRVGGPAEIFATVDTEEKLLKVLSLNQKITVIGNGSNLLVSDNGIKGIVLKYTAQKYNLQNEILTADSGLTNGKIAKILSENSLTGYEFASGIPGTLGGAIVMNAGAYGREMKDIILNTTYIDLSTKQIKTITNEEHHFEYRKSIFQNMDCIILKSTLKLDKGNREQIEAQMQEYTKKRIETQPLDKPNAGSTFKRGTNFTTAKLIDEAGLKGYSIGGAEVSTKHAGFIINKGNATAKDITDLIQHVKKVIYDKYGKEIELEIKIIGEGN